MTYKLPYGKFKYDKSFSKCATEYILNLNPNGKYFYVFVADIICPEELHDNFDTFPLLTDHEISPGDNTIKLMATLNDKKEYVISLHMLKFVLEKGYGLDKIHAIIYAKQKAFIKKFIALNNKKRTEASINNDQIGVHYYKNSSNSTFGKQIENPEKYRDFHIVTDENKAKNLASKCTFKEAHILDEDNNIVLHEMRRGQVLYDKPISVGFAILDISKLILYKLLHRLKEHYGKDNVEVVYTNTDSVKLYVEGKDVYDTRGIEDIIDTSNFSKITDKPLIPGINEKKLVS